MINHAKEILGTEEADVLSITGDENSLGILLKGEDREQRFERSGNIENGTAPEEVFYVEERRVFKERMAIGGVDDTMEVLFMDDAQGFPPFVHHGKEVAFWMCSEELANPGQWLPGRYGWNGFKMLKDKGSGILDFPAVAKV
ncbi:MAG: hypothetical protein DSO02_06730 [Hadesarchaea archaeon]|nr:MAG: hypothetical protein DSO02_06730 [Hadesarchaea archaeon]